MQPLAPLDTHELWDIDQPSPTWQSKKLGGMFEGGDPIIPHATYVVLFGRACHAGKTALRQTMKRAVSDVDRHDGYTLRKHLMKFKNAIK